ncbi:anti-sigma factor antagonist [Nocardia sp. NPDC003482]
MSTNHHHESDTARLRLTASLESRAEAMILRAHGEVDAYTLPTWQRLLRAAADASPGRLVVDTRNLGFLGYRAYVVLADEAVRSRGKGVTVCLVSTQAITRRILAATELNTQLAVYETIEAALAAPAARTGAGQRS